MTESANRQQPTHCLRVGIVIGDRVIEERTFRRPQTIDIGEAEGNAFIVGRRGLPATLPLIDFEGERCTLFSADEIDQEHTRVRIDGTDVPLAELPRERDPDGNLRYTLPPGCRGKIVIAEIAILFQRLNMPSRPQRSRLPKELRSRLGDRINPQLAIILLVSLLVHGSIATWAYFFAEPYVTSELEKVHQEFLAENYREATISDFRIPQQPTVNTEDEPENEPEPDPEPPAKTEREVQQPAKPAPKVPETLANETKTSVEELDRAQEGVEKSAKEAPTDSEITKKIEETPLMRSLAANREGDRPFADVAANDQGEQFAPQIASSGRPASAQSPLPGAGNREVRGDEVGEIGTGQGPKVREITEDDADRTGTEKEVVIASRATLEDVDDIDMTSLDPDAVARRIRSRYLPSIKRCHERALKRDATIGGRIDLAFTVSIAGRVTSAEIEQGIDPEVDQCVKKLTRSWSFSPPLDDDGKPTTASFVIPLVLKAAR